MLFVYFGGDEISVRQAGLKQVSALVASGAVKEELSSDNFEKGKLVAAVSASDLFGSRLVYVLDSPSLNNDFLEEVENNLADLGTSPNQFIWLEKSILAPLKKKLEKAGAEIKEFKKPATEARFNTFALADALAKKDKKNLWLLYSDAKKQGIAAEEIIGVLWWQLKSLQLAALTANASAAGMKDFPYRKAKDALRNFREGEVVGLSGSLLAVYHDGHFGRRDIDLALEEWVLSI